MAKDLSPREKLVMYSLVRAPSGTDRELSSFSGLKLSTVSAIRRRLAKRGYYARVRMPCLRGIGGEMLVVTYFYYKATVPMNLRLITGSKLVRDHKEVFWAGSEYTQALSLQLSMNLTDAKRNVAEIEELYTAQSFFDEGGITFLTFPFEISRIPVFFDYEPLLSQSFGIAGGGGALGYPTCAGSVPLTSAGKRVYRTLVENPGMTDTEVSRVASVSQRTATKLRERFEGEGLLKTVVVPNLAMLGFKMLVFDHAKLNLRILARQRWKILDELMRVKPPIFFAVGGDDVVALTAYEDFETYRRCINSFSEIYKEEDIFVREPKRLMFSLSEMKMLKEHVYGPIVRKALGV
ncbi:MAG: hypothetical protein AB1665_01875 [Candidatus Thermoplasmatota archaeon]